VTPTPIPFVLGHHKGGTRYVGRIVERLAGAWGLAYRTLNNPKWFGFDVRAALKDAERPFVNYMNADYAYLERAGPYRGVHIVRDPRDIALSAYFSHLYSHSTDWWPELVAHRRRLEALAFSDGLLLDLEFTERLVTDGFPITVFPAMERWNYHDPDILELRFESIIASPFVELSAALEHLGLLDEDRDRRLQDLHEAIEQNSFAILSGGRRIGEVDDRHHYRSGTPGEWRSRLEPSHIEWFRRYAPLLRRLGYEAGA